MMSIPVLFSITALMGALFLGWVFQRHQHPLWIGAAVGAAVGAAGPLIFMAPLSFCTFGAEIPAVDQIFGGLLFFGGAGIALAVAQWLSRVIFDRASNRATTEAVAGVFRTHAIVPILLLLPTLIILAVFLYFPALNTFRLSTLLTRLGSPRTIFRCVDNFTRLVEVDYRPSNGLLVLAGILVGLLIYAAVAYFRNANTERAQQWLGYAATLGTIVFFVEVWEPTYQQIVFNTFVISGAIVVFGLSMALGIAYLAFQPVRGAGIYRTLLIWSYAVSPPVAGIIFAVMFNPAVGLINHILKTIGLPQPNWFTDPTLAMVTIILASIWKTLGYNVLFYIAGLQNVSKELLEAAAIDGANAFERFWNITVPSLSPITFFLIITNITYAFFDLFGTIDFLTKGGPAGGTTVMIYEIYQLGIIEGDLGKAAAQSVILFVLVIGVTLFQFRTTGQRVSYGA